MTAGVEPERVRLGVVIPVLEGECVYSVEPERLEEVREAFRMLGYETRLL